MNESVQCGVKLETVSTDCGLDFRWLGLIIQADLEAQLSPLMDNIYGLS